MLSSGASTFTVFSHHISRPHLFSLLSSLSSLCLLSALFSPSPPSLHFSPLINLPLISVFQQLAKTPSSQTVRGGMSSITHLSFCILFGSATNNRILLIHKALSIHIYIYFGIQKFFPNLRLPPPLVIHNTSVVKLCILFGKHVVTMTY